MDDFPNQPGSEDSDQLRRRIEALEDQISTYERLLEELPDLFERKFQQRLEPLLERYRLLEHSVRAEGTLPCALAPGQGSPSQTQPDKVIRLGRWRWPRFLRRPSA